MWWVNKEWMIKMWKEWMISYIGNGVGKDEGHLLYDSLQFNSTLTELETECEHKQ